jgi:hypothetical protein
VSYYNVVKDYPIGYKQNFRVLKHNPNDCSDLNNEIAIFTLGSVFLVGSFVIGYIAYIGQMSLRLQNDQIELVKHKDSFSA